MISFLRSSAADAIEFLFCHWKRPPRTVPHNRNHSLALALPNQLRTTNFCPITIQIEFEPGEDDTNERIYALKTGS